MRAISNISLWPLHSALFPFADKKWSDTYVVKCISPKIIDFDFCPMTGRLHIVMFCEVLHLSFLPLPGVSSSLQFFIQPLQSGTAWHLDGVATSISLSSLACGEALRDAGCWLTACAAASSHVSVGYSYVSDPCPGCMLFVFFYRSSSPQLLRPHVDLFQETNEISSPSLSFHLQLSTSSVSV